MNSSIPKNLSIDLNLALQALDSANDGMSIVDVSQPDQPLIYVNKASECITGYTSEEILGKNCRFLQGKISLCEPERAMINNCIKNRESCQVTLRNITKQGEPFWNELSLAPIISADQSKEYFVGIQKDISSEQFK